jgi:hypothetical protein
MSDVRFACPFCSQHIACDTSYSGAPIDCPSCGCRINVPKPLAVDDSHIPIPVAEPAQSSSGKLNLWTEDDWQNHVRRSPGWFALEGRRAVLPQLPVLLALMLPGLVIVRANSTIMWLAIVAGALISGYVTRRDLVASDGHMIIAAGAFLIGMVYYGILAEVFLLGGCCWPTRT